MKKYFLFLIILIISADLIAQSAEELNKKSKDFILKEDYQNAYPLIKAAAEKGNAEAQCNYGICFKRGIIVPQNDTTAFSWFLKSADNGWAKGQLHLANCYAEGKIIKPDFKKFFEWTKNCALQGEADCMGSLSSCYEYGMGTKSNFDSMFFWQSAVAILKVKETDEFKGSVLQARVNLAEWYRDGNKIAKDNIKSYTWYLIYNEDKKFIYGFRNQEENITAIKELEKQLTEKDKLKAKKYAKQILKHRLKQLNKLYKPSGRQK
jgi:uncharacterized protein